MNVSLKLDEDDGGGVMDEMNIQGEQTNYSFYGIS